MSDHNKIDQFIGTLTELLAYLKDERSRLWEQASAGDYLLEFTQLKDLLRSSQWPPAVPAEVLCNPDSETDKKNRAQGILENMVSLDGLAFLDFGCGEGHITLEATYQQPRLSVGYDAVRQGWERFDSHTFKRHDIFRMTTDLAEMRRLGPYDVILCNDVLDHDKDGDPVGILKEIKKVKRSNGPVYLRCHPWTSRHATHLYQRINKAFLHLVFSEAELLKLGYKGVPTFKLLSKHTETYRKWFGEAKLKVESEKITRRPVEDFFVQHSLLNRRIKQNCETDAFPFNECNIEFIDYILS